VIDPLVQVAIVGVATAAINAVSLVVVAVIQSRASSRNHSAIQNVRENIQKIETATNSMKDDLVTATRLAGEAKGRDDERTRRGKTEGGASV